MHDTKRELTAIDLFCGGGGLSLGLVQGGFRIVSAIEINPQAFSTYKVNHPSVKAYKQDVGTIKGSDLLPSGKNPTVDLLAGCPPCQGFSSLTSKYRRDDPRNKLVLQMSRLVREVQPRAVMMENVPGLVDKGKPLFDSFLREIVEMGYLPEFGVLQVADYGVPQSRRRLVLLAGKGFRITLPPPTHSRDGEQGLNRWRTVSDVLSGQPDPLTLAESKKLGGPCAHGWHVVRGLSPKNVERLKYVNAGDSRTEIPVRLRPNCHKFRQKGFGNVYGRMSWDQVSPTITAGCTTLSKGRFGHPSLDRTISVREAALLQTFPKDYVIDTPFMEYACSIVGNALPVDFARILAEQCAKALRNRR